ncbi:MAG TPA: AAA family ATPase, partial [Candidatus Dormibacteraeota bacterium]|nr:AAA family ATPase [Candidatus Dormibacteraeota bacterium]
PRTLLFLKSLQLLGFKTFARQTEIQFDGGVTAIVGPNGSGKTNIVDSIKWVLGSGQARDLRGKKMEEVIYVGGERRNRASYAEVTLTFDNTAGRLPVDYHEVAIKRRIERDSESEYFLNGTRVRRRDLLHLLSSTGLTVDSYAIIDQHDIEHIVVCTPAERRQLLEEAAQVRGVKARRQEAANKLQELANNLLRLEDLKGELAPRLEALRLQAAAAREAGEASTRLELLKGSIVWEEWREARDAHRKATSQAQSLERRLIEAREQARIAEDEFQKGREAMQAAQDRRLARQRNLGQLRLASSEADHRLQLAEERASSRHAAAEAARRSLAESNTLRDAAAALKVQLVDELRVAETTAASIEAPPTSPEPDTQAAHRALREAEHARRAAANAASSLAAQTTRREFLEEQLTRDETAASTGDRQAVAEALGRVEAQIESLRRLPQPETVGLRLRDVLTAEPGYEELLEATLGALLDTAVAIPTESPEPLPGSLYEHVRVREGYDHVARRLLGGVVVGPHAPAALRSRRDDLRRRLADIDALDARLVETTRLLHAARDAETSQAAKLAELETSASGAETHAAELNRDLEQRIRELADQRAAYQQRELWRDRVEALRRQVANVEQDLLRLGKAIAEREELLRQAVAAVETADGALPELRQLADAARNALQVSEHDAPEDEAEMAESARNLVALEETRIDARLREGNLHGNLELVAREAELLQARMDDIRSRMPDGVAPEEVPGGKAREREMRALERRLEEIGPTNALAESECRELEERYENLAAQLEDIAAARTDLEDLIGKLREEEESRYEAVFGAVAANFHEYFSELNPGGRATLRHADGDDGPRSGVEILVQPPRKRLQNVTLLSSGERSLAALALVLALDEVNPSPFTILDEVDAALDDANVGRFGQMLARLGAQRQFLVITHNHVTMSYASSLYGIHLDESGSSHIVSVRLEDVRKPAARAAATLQAG